MSKYNATRFTRIGKIVVDLHTFFIHQFPGFRKFVQILIEKGANVNAEDSDSGPALVVAIEHGKIPNKWTD